MWRLSGTIEDMLNYLKANGWLIVERHGKQGNRDEVVLAQDKNLKLAWFSLMAGNDIDGNPVTLMVFEKEGNPMGSLF